MDKLKTLVVNGDEYRSHTRETEDTKFAVWRQADDLIKAGKKDEAAKLIKETVREDEDLPHSTLIFRVVLALEGKL